MATHVDGRSVAQPGCDGLRRARLHGRQRGCGHAHHRQQQQIDRRQQALELAGHAGAEQQQAAELEARQAEAEIEQSGEFHAVLGAPSRKRRLVRQGRLDAAERQPALRRLVEPGQHDVDQLRALAPATPS